MKLYEYMGKELFARYGIPVPRGKVVFSPAEALAAAREIGGPVVIKSQILMGKRGKGGGIRFAGTPEEAREAAAELLGMELHGYKVEALLVEERLSIDQELYVSLTIDGSAKAPVLIASAEGGMDIEEVPEERIIKEYIDLDIGLQPFVAREVARRLGLKEGPAKDLYRLLPAMYRLFREKDAELVEINPLVVSGERLVAADAKINIDDYALYRQKDLPYVDDRTPLERKAKEIGVSFVELSGDIAIMANGAGMSMGTLDTIAYYGGTPANFLDCGGGTGLEETAKALELLLETKPKVIFINIFGGITRCDDVAGALVKVKRSIDIPVPVVVRLVGTNEDIGRRILEEEGIKAYTFMDEAAAKAVELAKGA
ncbi:ADP-forming succinate--CoA ligase subunit beta [Desulfovirgula thermocuniculi]|uniref:ADP-forming succinate--CoA ligase subunit beta n=1 Tax=Desulfovirgula thermocuniculi TaxID=348842 RepID=UPI00040E8A8E|nr:ADP-forming succinate--CoA ligase subunit beta [Desulfovirgula thermocuniculi]